MIDRIWILKVACIASMLAGTVWVGLPALAQASLPGTGSVINTPPTISTPGSSPVYLGNQLQRGTSVYNTITSFNNWVAANSPVLVSGPITPRAGQSSILEYRFFVTDPDGTADIKDAQVKLLNPDGSVHDAYAPAHLLGPSSDITSEYYAEFELKYYDPPATGLDFYKVVVKVADAAIQNGNLTLVDNAAAPKQFQYGELSSLAASASSLDFGNLQANSRSAGVAVTLTNKGNVAADNTLSL